MGADGTILFLHAGALGDFVLTLHIAAAAKARLPRAALHMVARSPLAAWTVHRGLLASARDPDARPLHRLYAAEHFDPRTVDLPVDADLVVSFLGGPDAPVSRNLRAIYGDRVIAVDPRPRAETLSRRRHITRQWLDDLAAAGIALEVDESAPFAAPTRRPPGGCATRVIVHPGSGGREKCCPLEVFEAIVERLRGRGLTVSWIVGPVEMDSHGSGLAERLRQTAPVLREESLPRAADRLLEADVWVGNDSGMSHLAAACGLRTVVVFGPTDPAVWRPLGPRVEVIGLDFHRVLSDLGTHADRIACAAAGA